MNTHVGFHEPGALPKLYGSVKVGERGQVVIPQEARAEMGLLPGDKLLAMGGLPGVRGILLIKAESFSTLVTEISAKLSSLERLLRLADVEGDPPADIPTGRSGADPARAGAAAARRRRQGSRP
jgi:AbrB family looped-hinge helix DNA binding protein